jgi:uncharacterized protein (DUF58 family)
MHHAAHARRAAITRHAWSLGFILFALVIGGLTARDSLLLLAALPFLLYLIAGLLFPPVVPQLTISRSLDPGRAPAETPITVTLSLSNQGTTIAELEVYDPLPDGLKLLDGQNRHRLALPAGASYSFSYTISASRGIHQFTGVEVMTWSHWGVRSWGGFQPVASQFFAYMAPSRRTLRQVAIQPRRTRIFSGSIPARVGGEGTDFFGVRPYRAGDALRRINWPSSARHQESLFTNEFEQERVADVGLILDARQASNWIAQSGGLLEESLTAAMYLTDAFITQGNRVALLIYGETVDYTLPGYGKIQREKILQSLSRARLGQSQAFSELRGLPTQLFPAKSQIIFISPLLADDAPVLQRLRAFGYQVLVVSPNPLSFAAAQLGEQPEVAFATRLAQLERNVLLRQLRQAGIFALDWDTAEPFDQVAAARLRLTWLTRPGG